MEFFNFTDEWSTDDSLVELQKFLDALAFVAYFAIPLELIYFISMSSTFPHKLAFFYFGTFSVLCGSSYLTNLWRHSQFSETSFLLIIILQVFATVLSWSTVVIMSFVMPKLLRLRKGEYLLKNRVEELSGENCLMLREVATRRSIARLIDEIRSTIDGQCIVKAAVVGLGQIFNLEECSLWFPSETNKTLQLFHSFSCLTSVGSVVPMSLPVVAEICNNTGPMRIPHTCPLVKETKITRRGTNPEAVAIKVPLVQLSFAESGDSLDEHAMSYAAMVLVLPSDDIRKFCDYELELLGAVAKQVSVALVHASAVEESTMACDFLQKQNNSMEVTIRDIMTALRALEDSKIGVLHHVEMPLQALTISSSHLLETALTPQQKDMAEMVLKSTTYLKSLMQNERRVSTLQDGVLELNSRIFNLSDALNQVVDIVTPAAKVKRLSLSLLLTPDLPVFAVGDQGRLMQVILNVMSNAVKFTKGGYISVKASLAKPITFRAWRTSKFDLVSSTVHFYLRVQVEDSGCGIDPQEIPILFHSPDCSNRHSRLGICKQLLEAMEGRIWVESDGLGKGTTATLIVKLGLAESNDLL